MHGDPRRSSTLFPVVSLTFAYHVGCANNIYHRGFVVSPDTNVHGQYPSTKRSSVPSDSNESAPLVICTLLRVPQTFTVNPPRNLGPTPFRLTYNYSILKGVAGIIQILSGSFGLYRVSEGQFLRLGYASYSLTVVPYILMSFVNLLATLCEPQYPSMFLVTYRGLEPPPPPVADICPAPEVGPTSPDDITAVKTEPSAAPTLESDLLETLVIGAVGEAYGDLTQLDALSVATPGVKSQFFVLAVLLLGVCCIVAPYIIIQLLTSYQAGHSTGSQRAWLMAWLVISQFYGVSFYLAGIDLMRKSDSTDSKLILMCTIMVTGTASIGGFVVVGQMMTNDKICTVI